MIVKCENTDLEVTMHESANRGICNVFLLHIVHERNDSNSKEQLIEEVTNQKGLKRPGLFRLITS